MKIKLPKEKWLVVGAVLLALVVVILLQHGVTGPIEFNQ